MKTTDSGFFVIGGTLRHNAPSYVEREADHELLASLRKGEFCYVLTARQMGKSSLMARTVGRLREQGVSAVALDLTAVGQNLSPEQWYDGLMARLGRQLHLEEELEAYWQRHVRLGPVQRFFGAIRDLVLVRRQENLVVFVDEIDTVRSLPFSADEFFAAIRECYNRRVEDPEFKRLTFCLLGVAMPSDLIQDTRLTPFNIGRRIELHDFTDTESTSLAAGLGRNGQAAQACLHRILHWTNGHPYLTQRLCHAVASEEELEDPRATVDRVCRSLFLSPRAREQDDNLLFVRDRLLRGEADRASVLTLYEQLYRDQRAVKDDETNPLVSRLRLAGVVRSQDGCLRVRNRVYAHAFNPAWVRANMPDAELRRQRQAFWRGVLRTSGVAAALLAVLAGLVINARRAQQAEEDNARLRERSLVGALSEIQTRRLLRGAGQRFDGLNGLQRLAGAERSVRVRNEAIACLTLPDLRAGQAWQMLPDQVRTLAFDAGLVHFACADTAGNLRLLRAETGAEILNLPGPGGMVRRIWLNAPGSHLAAVGNNGLLRVWDLHKRVSILQTTNHLSEEAFDFSPDGKLAAMAWTDAKVSVIDLAAGGRQVTSQRLSTTLSALRFRPGTDQLSLRREVGLNIQLMDSALTRTNQEFFVRDYATNAFAWSPDGGLLAWASADKRIHVRHVASEREIELEGHQGIATRLAFSAGGRWLASAGTDGTLRLWDPSRGGRPNVTLDLDPAMEVPVLQFSADDRRLAAGLAGARIQLWQVELGTECQLLNQPAVQSLRSLDVHPEGRLAACAYEGGLGLWDLDLASWLASVTVTAAHQVRFNPASGDLMAGGVQGIVNCPIKFILGGQTIRLEIGPVRNLDLLPEWIPIGFQTNGATFAVHWEDRVRFLDVENPQLTRSEVPLEVGLEHVSLAPNGEWLAGVNGRKNEVSVWSVAGRAKVAVLSTNTPAALTWSPDSRWLAVATKGVCELWRSGGWQRGNAFGRPGATGRPAVTAFSPDGRVFAYAHYDFGVELAERESGTPLGRLEARRQELLSAMRFTPDGSRLICATEENTLQVWDLAGIRQKLRWMKLDWDPPSESVHSGLPAGPVVVSVEAGDSQNRQAVRRIQALHAVEEATKDLQAKPDDPSLLKRRADNYAVLEQYALALQDLDRVLAISATNRAALLGKARILMNGPASLRDMPLAHQLLTNAVAREPNSVEVHYLLGNYYANADDYTNALAWLQQAARLAETKRPSPSAAGRPDDQTLSIWLRLAVCYANTKDSMQAEHYFQKATIEMDSKRPTSEQTVLLRKLWEDARRVVQE